VFVQDAIAGDTVTFFRHRKRRSYDEAQLVEVLSPSPERVSPACSYFGICGGCSLQHVSSRQQIALKQSVLLDNLLRIGDVVPQRVLPALTGEVWRYRRKARLTVKYVEKKGRVLVGFRERNKPYVANMTSCETLHPAIGGLLDDLSSLIGQLSIRDRVPQIEVAVGDNSTAMIFRVLVLPSADDRSFLEQFQEAKGVEMFLQIAGPDSVRPLNGETSVAPLQYRLDGYNLCMEFMPSDFIQAHGQVNELMISQAVSLLDLGPDSNVLELYSGLGNFSLPMARSAAQVTGVELGADMVSRARENAVRNGLSNINFHVADLTRPNEAPIHWHGYDRVLLDPPRSGAVEALPLIGSIKAGRVVYVSCHPGTLARDSGYLVKELGYKLTAAGIMDMFPQTSHVESMALFEKQ
jgi:23S rRNA (uracil1939-C5)-methyltransferase